MRICAYLFTIWGMWWTMTLGVAAQDVTGMSIESIAHSVVLIRTLRDDLALSTGSGVLTTPTGQIYTNRHVIAGGSDFAIYLLADVGEMPELRYYASPVFVSDVDSIDFAVLQIDRDAQGQALDPRFEELPYIQPMTMRSTHLGDALRVFGYPAIGEGYLVATPGDVVMVQNGTIDDQRLPMWYWTDAEITGGTSGGLAVNTAGEMIGIPTRVIAEERTAGRLGGVLSLVAIESVLENADVALLPLASSLTVQNTSPTIICGVFISPITATDWGENLLVSEVLNNGEQSTWRRPPGVYDVLLQDCDGETLRDIRGVQMEGAVRLAYP